MSSYEIDGVTLPEAVAGHPALDFCNTRAGWNAPKQREYLVDAGVLAVWTRQAGLSGQPSGARPDTAPAEAVLARALVFREALYPVLLGRGTPDDWLTVSREAALAQTHARLVPPADGERSARWERDTSGLEGALRAVAASAADFLTGPGYGTVGACPGEGCGWLFTDPRGRRRWCSMAVCGNRAKARRYRSSGR
ncbi:CGNR zinc finger domain-containing protein [Kineosporia rhizophila]|uniref:CGNR zinc finger domain-containing protein n=1 Tax=Kineosporia TaxID=49184 RepID=UPI001E350B01|nr:MULTISPECIES: CGNR zinc finger domain-containing protein [Kineosporia]MCE0534290.1 CGNR zinc finger domain-containing protein [Kineosporia rhizophila]GLY13838.1 hypothetical protein Kisp01_08540 [Kineosporia sp. NBRC 101677]